MIQRVASLLLIASLSSSCDFYHAYQRGKQVNTQARLSTLAYEVERHRRETGRLPDLDKVTAEAVAKGLIADNRDAWGQPILVAVGGSPFGQSGEDSYLLVSMGADEELDVNDISEYFETPEEESVAGLYHADIVIRDGVRIRNAGK